METFDAKLAFSQHKNAFVHRSVEHPAKQLLLTFTIYLYILFDT